MPQPSITTQADTNRGLPPCFRLTPLGSLISRSFRPKFRILPVQKICGLREPFGAQTGTCIQVFFVYTFSVKSGSIDMGRSKGDGSTGVTADSVYTRLSTGSRTATVPARGKNHPVRTKATKKCPLGRLQPLDDHGLVQNIIMAVKRDRPELGKPSKWRDLHQGDLARCMRVCSVSSFLLHDEYSGASLPWSLPLQLSCKAGGPYSVKGTRQR